MRRREERGLRQGLPELFVALRHCAVGDPCVAPSSSLGLGDVGEDCSSLAETLAPRLSEFRSRRGQAGSTGNAHRARHLGGFLFGTFLLAEQEKGTGVRM